MALIKQRRQFLPQSIGVVRPDTGAEFVARGAERLANSMIESSFDQLKREARKAGVETAQAASAASLRTINPETGRPEAFKVPGGFGIAAQQAYEETIEKRYINQTESDIKLKAQEIALKLQNDPDGAAKYGTELGDYIDALSANASPKFANIINNVGGVVLASGKLNLEGKQLERQRADLAASAVGNIDTALQDYRDVIALGGSEEEAELALSVVTRAIQIASDGFPEVYNAEAQARTRTALLQAKSFGAADRLVAASIDTGATSDDLIQVAEFLKAPSSEKALADVPDSLRSIAQELVSTDGFRENRASILGIIGDQESDLSKAEVNVAAAKSQTERDNEKAARKAADKTTNGIADREDQTARQITGLFANGDFTGAIQAVVDYEASLNADRTKYEQGGVSDAALDSSIVDQRQYALKQGLEFLADSLTYEESANLALYMERDGNVDVKLPEEAKKKADTLRRLMSPADDLDTVQQVMSGIVSVKKPKTLTKKEQAKQNIRSEGFVRNDATHREATSEIVAETVGVDVNDITAWFGTDESRPNNTPHPVVRTTVARGVPPQALLDFLEGVADGRDVLDRSAENALNHWADHALSVRPDGNIQNSLLLQGLDPATNAMYQAAFAIKQLEPNRPVKDIYGGLIQARQNLDRVESNSLITFTGGRYDDFKTGKSRLTYYVAQKAMGNGQILSAVTPLVEILVASGTSFTKIDQQVDAVINSIFAPTDGLVTDVMSPVGSRSMHSLDNSFPDPAIKRIFINKVARLIEDEAPDGFIFSPSALGGLIQNETGPYPAEKIVTLTPLAGQSAAGQNTLFMAVSQNEYGQLVPVPNNVNGAPIIVPLSIANQEIQARAESEKRKRMLEGQASEEAKAKRLREMQAGELERPDFPTEDAS